MKFWISTIAVLVGLASSFDAEATKRLGGGSSVGRQSSNVTQREAQKNAAPQQQQAAPAGAGNAAAKPQASGIGRMLGFAAAGLGLAWLAHALGFGEAFGQFMVVLLLVIVAAVAFAWFMRSRRQQPAHAYAGPVPADVARMPRQYSPDKVGNDASARPWERAGMAFDTAKYAPAAGGGRIGSALGGTQPWGIPAGFDGAGFVAAAKQNFIALQDA